MKNEKSYRIAFLGGGAHTIPTYRAQLKRIAEAHDITLYSEFFIDKREAIYGYSIKSTPEWKWKRPRRLRELYFGSMVFFRSLFKRYDIIHTHSTYPAGCFGVLIGKLLRIPVIVSLDAAEAIGIPEIGFGDLLNRKRTWVNRFVIKKAKIVTCLTQFQQRTVIQNLRISREIRVIPRGVNITKSIRDSTSIKPPYRFLNVGYINEVKDQKTLLDCFLLLSEVIPCHLTIVGEDYSNGEVADYCKQLNLSDRVDFIGFVPHENIKDYYSAADFLLHTSRYESQALVVVEALAHGLLVCGTKVGLLADLSGECCVTVEPGESETLAAEICAFIKDPIRVDMYKLNAKEWVKEHSLEWTCGQYFALYMEARTR